MKSLLVTGGCGYIGSHTVVELLKHGYKVVVYDNFVNSSLKIKDRIFELTGDEIQFIEGDVRDDKKLDETFTKFKIDGVLHFAGLKDVNESVQNPILYHEINVLGSLQLLKMMKKHDVKTIVFSSSATIYGASKELPLLENTRSIMPLNPYGSTKLMVEQVLRDIYCSDNSWRIIILRYFNPVGAHPSGLLGESPVSTPGNLMPLITQTANGEREYLSVFGDDYDTPDGTCIRDYIHVVDVAQGHINAVVKCKENIGIETVNLGTGQGYSVLQVLKAFEKVNNIKVPFKVVGRRAGDTPVSYADVQYAGVFLNWSAKLGLEDMCRDSWNWQKKS